MGNRYFNALLISLLSSTTANADQSQGLNLEFARQSAQCASVFEYIGESPFQLAEIKDSFAEVKKLLIQSALAANGGNADQISGWQNAIHAELKSGGSPAIDSRVIECSKFLNDQEDLIRRYTAVSTH
jgi:hypothetical protein